METMKTNGTGTRVWDFSKRFLAHRYLPAALAIGAILVMLPALKIGLFWDDLPQRVIELKPSQLPSRMYELGIPANSGSFSTVLNNLFNYLDPKGVAMAKNYGIVPWWTPDHVNVRLALWRPVTAFTHWLDYRLFPDSPMLMHAENIACFAAIVFLVTVIYRKLMGAGWVAGLAALLYLLDYNIYFPVAYVANRGFMLSLFFGLLCLYEHHQWRSAKSRSGLVLSALFLALSLLTDEGGASTFAFLLAYALALEPGSFRHRALTILPAILIIVLWRAIYTFSGFGVFGIGIYIDPANEPLSFARVVIPRAMLLLGGQLAGVAPEVPFAVNPSLQPMVAAFFCVIAVTALAVFLPWVRRDKMAAFWFAVMLLAVIPAATVVPMSKNLGFVAVGAYGLIASFVAGLIARPAPPSSSVRDYGAINRLPEWLTSRIPAWIACILLILIHVPVAIAGRVVAVKATAHVLWGMNGLGDIGDWPNIENENVIVVNPPSVLAFISAPFYKAYHHQPLPRTLRALVPGCTSFDVERTDDKTLVIQSKTSNIFFCDDFGPVRGVYLASACDRFLLGGAKCKKGARYDLNGLTVEVLESDASGLPSRVAFRFNNSLDSPDFHWLRFDLRMALASSQPYQPFKIPAIGQSVTLSAPHR
jgi:hypothetical protein